MTGQQVDDHQSEQWLQLAAAIEAIAEHAPRRPESPAAPFVDAGLALVRDLARILPIRAHVRDVPRTADWYSESTQIDSEYWRGVNLEVLVEAIDGFAALIESSSWPLVGRALVNATDDLDRLVKQLAIKLPAEDDSVRQRLDVLTRRIAATRRALDPLLPMIEAQEQLQEIRQVRKSVQVAAGEVADAEIAEFFRKYATRRRQSYWLWTLAVVAGLGASVLIGYMHLDDADVSDISLNLARLAVVVPLLIFAGYAGRQAGQNRHLAEEFELAYLRARSIDAFVQRLPTDQATDVIHRFGLAFYAVGLAATPVQTDGATADGIASEFANLRVR